MCIGLLRGRAEVLERRAAAPDHVATTPVTAAELFYGAAKSTAPGKNRDLVRDFLGTIQVLALDGAAAELFGELKALLERRGEKLADADLLIAAITLANGAALATGNARHYARIPGLNLQNWLR